MSRLDTWFEKMRAPKERRTADLQRAFYGNSRLLAQLRQPPGVEHVTDEPRPEIKGYRIVDALGSGGMSTVWLAERTDGVLNRRVALKLPQLDPGASVDMRRFEFERDTLAKLEHQHIARLYDAGFTQDGRPFIVLEHIHGAPITEYCDARALTIADRLGLFQQVLAAVQFSHSIQVVHRDLKPSNVLVDEQGQVKLLDFGIAKPVSEPSAEVGASGSGPVPARELTLPGGMVGTPLYAAPEQLEGGSPIKTVTDIYVLGIVLYELLTGVHPHMKEPVGVVKKDPLIKPSASAITDSGARRRGLRRAAKLRATLKGDLDDIVSKAMNLKQDDRYASAAQFADDIRCSLELRPIAGRKQSWSYSTRRFLRRNRAASLAAGLGLCAALVIGTVAMRQHQQAQVNDARTIAVRNFIFELVNDAEPSETQPVEAVTGKQMVDAAVRRARVEFADQPRLRGELLGELGRMYGRLGTPNSERNLLREALRLLELNAPEDDPALNKTRAHVAELELEDDDIDGARQLAALSRSSCTRADAECAKARAYGCRTLAKIALREGRTDAALAEMRSSVAEMERGFGARHSETALAYANLAVMARNAGFLQEAAADIGRALEISQHQTLRLADRRMIQQTVAVLDIDLGRYRDASDRLESLLVHAATAAERALQWRLLANALLLQRRTDATISAADRAIEAATEVGEGTEILFSRQARARALALTGRHALAQTEIEAVIAGLLKTGRVADSPAVVRARRAQGEILARAGRWLEAYEKLQSLASVEFEQGESMDLLGCTALELGRQDEALSLHRRARVLLEKKLPADHPSLLRNTLYQETAAAKQGSAPGCAHIL